MSKHCIVTLIHAALFNMHIAYRANSCSPITEEAISDTAKAEFSTAAKLLLGLINVRNLLYC